MVRTRRSFLATATTALATGALAGCTGLGSRGRPIEVLAAGSLQNALDPELADAADEAVAVEARGSAAIARLVAEGQRDPDVLALADTALFDRILDGAWHAAFATNALAVATADTDAGRGIQEASRWFEPFVDGNARLGRTDPDLDPLGYRTRFALELVADRHDSPGLFDAVLDPDQVYPETALLSQLETGAVDAAVVYESMAVERDLEFVDLHPAIDLSDPGRADDYRRVSYDLSEEASTESDGGGTDRSDAAATDPVVRGDVIEYGATLRSPNDDAARRVFDAVVDGDVLATQGFEVPGTFPRYSENAPTALQNR